MVRLSRRVLLAAVEGVVLLVASLMVAGPAAAAVPPYDGTIFLDPDVIIPSDPTTLLTLSYAGRGERTVFDRRVNGFVTINAYLFDASYTDRSRPVEAVVNPEFGSVAAARSQARKYTRIIGQLPASLLVDLDQLWIHRGREPFGGGSHSVLIHTGQAAVYEADGILEETIVHEATHTSLDDAIATSPRWRAAQAADPTFISTYARDNPVREDVAESFLPYLMVRYRADRISPDVADTIRRTMPHRMAYFDRQGLFNGPLARTAIGASQGLRDGWIPESSAKSNAGGKPRSRDHSLSVGDDNRDRQRRSLLSFDTSDLPDGAVLTRVRLRVHLVGATHSPRSLGAFRADIRRGTFGGPALGPSDFASPATRTLVVPRPTSTTGVYSVDLTAGRSAVDKRGPTQIRIRFARQDDGDQQADLVWLASGDARPALRPTLVVQYGSR